jgi:ElaB/YqjD/DUF883 family membrane-anchored ribosome-binding protein
MNTQEAKERAQNLLRETDDCIRANPVPAILTALAVGFVIGALSRLVEPPPPPREPWHDALDDLRAAVSSGAKRGKKAYAQTSDAVREAVEHAVERAREVDVDPVVKWWRKLWT